MKKFYVPNAFCPKCLTYLDGASNVEDDGPPKPGDTSVCINCMTIMCFTDTLGLREMTEEEMITMPQENKDALLKAVILVAAYHTYREEKDATG